MDPIFGSRFWNPLLVPIFENAEKWPPEGPRADLGPRPSKVSKQNCLGATILGSPPKPGTPFGTPFLDPCLDPILDPILVPIFDPILDPIFGPLFGPHFWTPVWKMLKNCLRRAPGPIWAPRHLKCQSKTALERPFWGAPPNQGPHFWTPFWKMLKNSLRRDPGRSGPQAI